LPGQRLCIVKNVCKHAYRLHNNNRCYHIILRAKYFYTNLERCEVLTGYLSSGCRPGGDWANTWHRAKRCKSSFQRWTSSSSPSYCHIFFLIAFLYWKYNNYTMRLIITCINKNNAIMNRNYERAQGLIFFFKITMGTRNIFLGICRKFGHTPSTRFASPLLGSLLVASGNLLT
jgi:hypothetical protein